MTYLLLQLVGFCWAILVNAAFSIACQSSAYLPPLEVLVSFFRFSNPANLNASLTSSFSSIQVVSGFYVSYASIRVVIGFAQSIFTIALQSIKDFPDAAKILAQGGSYTLNLVPLVFIPSIVLEVVLLASDFVCIQSSSDDELFHIASNICHFSGMYYLTSSFPNSRKIVVYAVIVMVVQLWQSCLHEFPRWDKAFRHLPAFQLIICQGAVFILSIMLALTLFAPTIILSDQMPPDLFLLLTVTGWTFWLFFFYPRLKQIHGDSWAERVTPDSIEHLAAYIRLSLMALLGIIFCTICYYHGFLQAQLDLTFITIVLPALYCTIYLIAIVAMKSGTALLLYGVPISLAAAIIITQYLAVFSISADDSVSASSQNSYLAYGQGSMFLVFFHIFSKIISLFGDDLSNDYEAEVESISEIDEHIVVQGGGGGSLHVHQNIRKSISVDNIERSLSKSDVGLTTLRRNQSFGIGSYSNDDVDGTSPHSLSRASSMHRISSNADLLLAERGQDHSTLVALGLPKSVSSHWMVTTSQKYLSYVGNIARALTITDSVLSSVIMVFIAIIAILTLMLCVISVGSFAQDTLQLFPKTMNFHMMRDSSVLMFDHRISNVTLYTNHSHPAYQNATNGEDDDTNTCQANSRKSYYVLDQHSRTYKDNVMPLLKPTYAACGWKSHGLALLDYALMSELAYYDDDDEGVLQTITDALFPSSHFTVKSSLSSNTSGGPIYLELHSLDSDLTILAVRGTDVGRLHDFLEDVKLYAEPVTFTLLSAIFPTIRLWTHETTSTVIEWLYEFNSFFGLQGEAEYYRPLVQRVLQLVDAEESGESDDGKQRNRRVVITGHSLGGGLARIVGTLSGQPSISFSPPGLGLSYRKYSTRTPDGKVIKVHSKGSVHHNSVAVVTELDWITQIDEQVGLVQKILCDLEDSAHQNACHLLEGTICHLLRHCGDDSNRFVGCDFSFDLKVLIPSLSTFAWNHSWIFLPIVFMVSMMVMLAIVPELL